MAKLRRAEKRRSEAIEDLKDLGVVRNRGFVGAYGEELAKRYYRVRKLEPPSNAGFDLVRRDGQRVQVKTLRSTPTNPRSTIGVLQPDYDVLLAIRLDADYKPVEAIEASKEVVERHFGRGRVTWTKTFAADDAVQEITAEQLLRTSR